MVITETPCAFSLPRTQVNRSSQRRNSVFRRSTVDNGVCLWNNVYIRIWSGKENALHKNRKRKVVRRTKNNANKATDGSIGGDYEYTARVFCYYDYGIAR